MPTGVKLVAVHIEVRYREQVIRELHDFRLLKLEIGQCEKTTICDCLLTFAASGRVNG